MFCWKMILLSGRSQFEIGSATIAGRAARTSLSERKWKIRGLIRIRQHLLAIQMKIRIVLNPEETQKIIAEYLDLIFKKAEVLPNAEIEVAFEGFTANAKS
jgi:hypothetical protein